MDRQRKGEQRDVVTYSVGFRDHAFSSAIIRGNLDAIQKLLPISPSPVLLMSLTAAAAAAEEEDEEEVIFQCLTQMRMK
jgi:hypothetical protein